MVPLLMVNCNRSRMSRFLLIVYISTLYSPNIVKYRQSTAKIGSFIKYLSFVIVNIRSHYSDWPSTVNNTFGFLVGQFEVLSDQSNLKIKM